MGRTIIKAPRIFDGDSMRTYADGIVIFEDDRILYAGSQEDAPRVSGEEYVWTDGTIMPGLIDAHVHLTMDGSADPSQRHSRILSLWHPFEP